MSDEQASYPSGADPTIPCADCDKRFPASEGVKVRYGKVGTPAEKVKTVCPECGDDE